MKFIQDDAGEGHRIEHYDKGVVTVNGSALTRSLIVTPEALIDDWRPVDFSQLAVEDMEQVAELQPELVILGTGASHHFPLPQLIRPLVERQIGLESMDTAAACRTYNILMAEGRRVAAALFMI